MHSTPNATANETLHVIAAALADDHRRIHGQVMLEGECFGVHGAFGIPPFADRRDWVQRPTDVWSISPVEMSMSEGSAKSIRNFLNEVTSAASSAFGSSAEARSAAPQ